MAMILKKCITISIFFLLLASCSSKSWRDASRESANIAPKVHEINDHIFQVYYARAFSWRGYFGVHPWVSWKLKEDSEYSVAQVTSWNIRREGRAINFSKGIPDRLWYDNYPTVIFEARGEKALKIVQQVKELMKNYPFNQRYSLMPGPNSNTFVSYLIRNIDDIDIELPPHAIGKDYLGKDKYLEKTASNTGYVFSFRGLIGLTLGLKEGVELNLGGLHFGVDFWPPAIKLPFVGRLGFKDQ